MINNFQIRMNDIDTEFTISTDETIDGKNVLRISTTETTDQAYDIVLLPEQITGFIESVEFIAKRLR